MNNHSIELIVAYHDGELGPEAAAQVRRLIEEDVEARRFYEAIKHSDDLLRQTLNPVLDKPVPKGIDSAVRRLGRRHQSSRWMPVALAASVAVIAVLLVRQEQLDESLDERLAEMQREIVELRYQTLENTPSGTVKTWVSPSGDSRSEVTPVKTYRTADNRYCREYEERITDDKVVEVRRGIACRVGKANWPDQASLPSPKKQF